MVGKGIIITTLQLKLFIGVFKTFIESIYNFTIRKLKCES